MKEKDAKRLKAGDRVTYKEDGTGATVTDVSTYGGGYITLDVDGEGEALVHTQDAIECLELGDGGGYDECANCGARFDASPERTVAVCDSCVGLP